MSYQGKMVINGEDHVTGAWLESRNPANPPEIVGTFPAGTGADVDLAVHAAQAAFPGWSTLSLERRLGYLARAARQLGEAAEGTARLLTREMGKILAESRADAGSSGFLLGSIGDYAVQALAPSVLTDDEYGRVVVERTPVGVVGAIVPWNWPLGLLMNKVAPAIAAGNTLVCVPSPTASLSATALIAQLARELPPGVVNIVTGNGAEVGAALAAHPQVRALSFTGGTATGKSVLRATADNLTITTLELGGNDAALVLDDVEVTDELASRLMAGALVSSGQVCFAVKRIYVAERVFADLYDAAAKVLSRAVVGNGLDQPTTLGPLANAAQFERARSIRQEAVDRGARVAELGQHGERFNDVGYFMMPALITGVDESYRVVSEEQFAPLVPIVPVASEDEAVARANDTEFGLSSSVWSGDVDRARRVARRLEAGITYINQHDMDAVDLSAPLGGYKHSGIGREQGTYGFDGFTELHAIIDRRVSS
jgi:aldehyde dehydrogenase